MKNILLFIACAFLASCASSAVINDAKQSDDDQPKKRLLYRYESSSQCSGCHADQFQQYEESMHAKAFSNPIFNTQYFNDIVPRAQQDPKRIPEARQCVACHAPVVFMNYTGLVSTPAQAARYETGVTCDFCHTLGGYAENGDYEQVPSRKKQGPFQTGGAATFHAEYSGFMQLGEYCGRCHNATNHTGLEVKSTYYEWRESSYGMRKITCQECHMSKYGYQSKGTAEFERGQAAHMNIGSVAKKQNEHDKLYTHSFPGAHSESQLQDALPLEIKVGTRMAYADGKFPFVIHVNNERSGHKMPSGSSDLRFMWLEVTATDENGVKIPVALYANNKNKIDYSIAGASPDDAVILQNDVPTGSRLYRTVLANAEGRQLLYQYDAEKNIFDNRLGASEIRKEDYFLRLPERFSGKVALEARLYYKGAPSSFTTRIQAPDFKAVLVASQKKQIKIEAARATR